MASAVARHSSATCSSDVPAEMMATVPAAGHGTERLGKVSAKEDFSDPRQYIVSHFRALQHTASLRPSQDLTPAELRLCIPLQALPCSAAPQNSCSANSKGLRHTCARASDCTGS